MGKTLNDERGHSKAGRAQHFQGSSGGKSLSGHSRTSTVSRFAESDDMPCSLCSVNFTILKRKVSMSIFGIVLLLFCTF